MAPPHIWHVWPSQHWPASREQEARFLSDLQKVAERRCRKPSPETPRHSVTAILYALRSGTPARILCKELPGEIPYNLIAAYNLLNSRRGESVKAWEQIVKTPEALADPRLAVAASRILHTPMRRIMFLHKNAGPRAAKREIEHTQSLIAVHQEMVTEIEQKLTDPELNPATAIQLGLQLHNPRKATLWASDYYAPQRVTDISAARVADLLAERTVQQ